jgi:hypothetical protein
MLDPQLLMMFAVGTLLLVNGIFERSRLRRQGGDEGS